MMGLDRLRGHHAVVTGGARGIGDAIASALDTQGAAVSLIVRDGAGYEEAIRNDPRYDRPRFYQVADVADRHQVERALRNISGANGPISILINNAGAAAPSPFDRTNVETWERLLAVNLSGAFHCSQVALPELLRSKNGRIVNIASTAGLKGYAYSAPYVAAKHGLVGLTRAMAAEFAKTNLTVNAVCPGFTDTDMVAEAAANISAKTGRSEEAARAELAKFNPQGRLVPSEEVADAVLWLCLPESRSINGQAIAVAGGEVM